MNERERESTSLRGIKADKIFDFMPPSNAHRNGRGCVEGLQEKPRTGGNKVKTSQRILRRVEGVKARASDEQDDRTVRNPRWMPEVLLVLVFVKGGKKRGKGKQNPAVYACAVAQELLD